MIVRGFKPVGWVAAVGSAALCCYMLSLQVAAERSELASLERRIVQTRQDIRSLQTELGTRGRLQQLEQWNTEVLALSAPVSQQYLDSNLSLARFDVQDRSFAAEAQVRMAAAQSGSAGRSEATEAVRPPVRLASAPASVSVAEVPAAANPVDAGRPMVRRASLVNVPPASAPVVAAMARPRSGGLLDEQVLRELSARSRSEGDGGAPN